MSHNVNNKRDHNGERIYSTSAQRAQPDSPDLRSPKDGRLAIPDDAVAVAAVPRATSRAPRAMQV